MIELAVVFALGLALVLACVVVFAVLNVLGHAIGGVFEFLGWLIALPFTILGWIVSAISFLLAGPLLLLVLLAPLALVVLAVGAGLLIALSPAILVGALLFAVARALGARDSRRSTGPA